MPEAYGFDKATAEKLVKLIGGESIKPPPVHIRAKTPPKQYRDPGRSYTFRNDSSETIPAYGCMRVTDSQEDPDTGRLVVVVDKPNSTGGPFLFNGPREVEAGAMGQHQPPGVVDAYYTSGTPAVGEAWGPESDWMVASGGDDAIEVFGDIATEVLRGLMPDSCCGEKVIGGGTSDPTDSTYVCCECTKPQLTICGADGFSFVKTKVSVVTSGSIQHYIDIVCDDDGSTLTLSIPSLSCSTTTCGYLDLTGTSLGTCGDIGIVYYGNDSTCCKTACAVHANGFDMGTSTETFTSDPTGVHDGWTLSGDAPYSVAGSVAVGGTASGAGSEGFNLVGTVNPLSQESRTLTMTVNMIVYDFAALTGGETFFMRTGVGFDGSNDLDDEYITFEWETDVPTADLLTIKTPTTITPNPNDDASHEFKIVIEFGDTTADTEFFLDGTSKGTRTGWTHGIDFSGSTGACSTAAAAVGWVHFGWTQCDTAGTKIDIEDMTITFL